MWTDYCVGADIFSVVAAWNTDTYGENGPRTWADFFDVEKFPGTRAMRAKVDAQLEAALVVNSFDPRSVEWVVLVNQVFVLDPVFQENILVEIHNALLVAGIILLLVSSISFL